MRASLGRPTLFRKTLNAALLSSFLFIDTPRPTAAQKTAVKCIPEVIGRFNN